MRRRATVYRCVIYSRVLKTIDYSDLPFILGYIKAPHENLSGQIRSLSMGLVEEVIYCVSGSWMTFIDCMHLLS